MRISVDEAQKARNRIQRYVTQTPFVRFDYLSKLLKKEIWLKCENFQHTGSFKIRGAANCILQNVTQAKKMGTVTASAGNHAQGVAAVCHLLGIRAQIVMPVHTPPIKVHNTQSWGAEIILKGNVYDESFEHALTLSKQNGGLFIHPFRDTAIMAGQGTIALELIEDEHFHEVEAVLVSVGGGGLISGIGSVLKSLRPELKVYGVTAQNAPGAYKAFHERQPQNIPVKFTLADGVAAKKCDAMMLGYLTDIADEIFSVDENSIAHAISQLAEHGKMVAEGAGVLPVAALSQVPEKKVALIISGGNVDLPTLSLVTVRDLVIQGRLARLVITIVDRPGGLHAVTQILAQTAANIVQVYHQRATLHAAIGEAEIEVDIETKGEDHTKEIICELTSHGFHVQRVT